MYMTKIELNHSTPANIAHSHIEQAFKNKTWSRHLWRHNVDNLGREYILLVSPNKPNNLVLSSLFQAKVITKDYNLNNIKLGNKYQFYFKVNTIKTVNNKHIPIKDENELNNFLIKRADKLGFDIIAGGFDYQYFDSFVKKGRTIPVAAGVYQGILQVTDLDKFLNTLKNGFGREKAYGMGLLTIAPYEG